VPTCGPVLLLAHIAAVPGGLALRANLEGLHKAHNLAPFVVAIPTPHHRFSANVAEHIEEIVLPCYAALLHPM
jgi:hypothetical protein